MRPLRPRRRARATRPRSHCCISLSLWSVDCAILPPTSPARMPRTAQRPTRADRPSRPVYCGKLLNGHPPTGPARSPRKQCGRPNITWTLSLSLAAESCIIIFIKIVQYIGNRIGSKSVIDRL